MSDDSKVAETVSDRTLRTPCSIDRFRSNTSDPLFYRTFLTVSDRTLRTPCSIERSWSDTSNPLFYLEIEHRGRGLRSNSLYGDGRVPRHPNGNSIRLDPLFFSNLPWAGIYSQIHRTTQKSFRARAWTTWCDVRQRLLTSSRTHVHAMTTCNTPAETSHRHVTQPDTYKFIIAVRLPPASLPIALTSQVPRQPKIGDPGLTSDVTTEIDFAVLKKLESVGPYDIFYRSFNEIRTASERARSRGRMKIFAPKIDVITLDGSHPPLRNTRLRALMRLSEIFHTSRPDRHDVRCVAVLRLWYRRETGRTTDDTCRLARLQTLHQLCSKDPWKTKC
ncbi:hypothetical protein Bbelb_061590 [Branchiostoma belcheri]|nr:hypothetical protein Bbelb_061590 [Branchiostoma belcheri]